MEISKTTINMAAKRGVSIIIYVNQGDKNETLVEFCGIGEDGEAIDEFTAMYCLTADGLHWRGSCFSGLTEEWPNWITDDSHLRGLLDAMAVEIIN